jgi:hypothetical protein
MADLQSIAPGGANSVDNQADLPGQNAETAALPSAGASDPAKHRFHAGAPNNVSIYVQPTYDFFRNVAGIPDGVYVAPVENVDGNYNFTAGGPMVGYTMGPEISFGLDYRRYVAYTDPKHPERELYGQKGPRFSLSGALGTYHITDYTFTGTASTQQLQDKWGVTQYQLENAAGDAIYGNFSSFAYLLQSIPSLWGDYDFTNDFYGDVVESYRDVPYYRLGGTIWFGNSIYNASTPINVFESAHFGVMVGAMGMGNDAFGGLGLAAETSLLRLSPPSREQNYRADVILNASADYYREMEPSLLFQDGFWGDGHIVDVQAGISLRISTDVPGLRRRKTIVKDDAALDAVKSQSDTEETATQESSAVTLSPREAKRRARQERRQKRQEYFAERAQNFDVPMDLDDMKF